MAEDIDLLLATRILGRAHVVRPEGHLGLEPGDQTGLLDPVATQPLVARVIGMLPGGIRGLAIGEGLADVLIGYLVARERGFPLASVTNVDGMVEVRGHLPEAGDVWLLVTLLDEAATVAEFEAACRRTGATAAGVVALVDRLPHPDPRVRSLARWSEHLSDPDTCPVCAALAGEVARQGLRGGPIEQPPPPTPPAEGRGAPGDGPTRGPARMDD